MRYAAIGADVVFVEAPTSLEEVEQNLGVTALVAEDLNSLFFRNAVNAGLPAVAVPGVATSLRDGDHVRVDVRAATVTRPSDGLELAGTPMPEYVFDIVARGGLRPKLQADGFLPSA